VVFGLVLHSSHQQQPEEIVMGVVSTGDDLVVDEGHFWVFLEPDFSLVVADEDIGGVEPCDQAADHKFDKVASEGVE
jgi:hypothetical protein